MAFFELGIPVGGNVPLQQGDIIANVPFVAVSAADLLIVNPTTGDSYRFDATATEGGVAEGSAVLAGIELGYGMVLTQTCDITGAAGRLKPVLLARVQPTTAHTRTEVKNLTTYAAAKRASVIQSILANPGATPNMFYLPPVADGAFNMPASYVNLLDSVTLASADAVALRHVRRFRLSAEALQALQERLAYCFGRFAAPDQLFFTPEEASAQAAELQRKASASTGTPAA
jgi:hypothetical protein